jgi:hypothetical protein
VRSDGRGRHGLDGVEQQGFTESLAGIVSMRARCIWL